jgi:hypothetical protein
LSPNFKPFCCSDKLSAANTLAKLPNNDVSQENVGLHACTKVNINVYIRYLTHKLGQLWGSDACCHETILINKAGS